MKKSMAIIITSFIVSNWISPIWAFGGNQYEITVTNLTRGQIFSPILVATHKAEVKLFELGEMNAVKQPGRQ